MEAWPAFERLPQAPEEATASCDGLSSRGCGGGHSPDRFAIICAVSWRIRGSYFESCNCDPICPCRRIDGRPGGRSTHGVCMGVLAWLIDEGAVDGIEVSGLPVA